MQKRSRARQAARGASAIVATGSPAPALVSARRCGRSSSPRPSKRDQQLEQGRDPGQEGDPLPSSDPHELAEQTHPRPQDQGPPRAHRGQQLVQPVAERQRQGAEDAVVGAHPRDSMIESATNVMFACVSVTPVRLACRARRVEDRRQVDRRRGGAGCSPPAARRRPREADAPPATVVRRLGVVARSVSRARLPESASRRGELLALQRRVQRRRARRRPASPRRPRQPLRGRCATGSRRGRRARLPAPPARPRPSRRPRRARRR